MNPSRVGIYAPYTWDEATYMACTLADVAIRLGAHVDYLTYQACNSGVHAVWDSRVRGQKTVDFVDWVSSRSHVVWFDVQPNRLLQAQTYSDAKNILVLSGKRLQDVHVEYLADFDAVFCPQQRLYEAMLALNVDASFVYCNWDSGLPIVEAVAASSSSRRGLVLLDTQTVQSLGLTICFTLRYLLDYEDDCYFTVLHTRNMPVPVRAAFSELLRDYPEQVQLLKNQSLTDRIAAYASHDWVFVPSVEESSCLYASEALCCRRPVVAFDLPPHNEILKNGHNGSLLPCQVTAGRFGLPRVQANYFDVLEHLRYLTDNPEWIGEWRQNTATSLQARREAFLQTWQGLWELD